MYERCASRSCCSVAGDGGAHSDAPSAAVVGLAEMALTRGEARGEKATSPEVVSEHEGKGGAPAAPNLPSVSWQGESGTGDRGILLGAVEGRPSPGKFSLSVWNPAAPDERHGGGAERETLGDGSGARVAIALVLETRRPD